MLERCCRQLVNKAHKTSHYADTSMSRGVLPDPRAVRLPAKTAKGGRRTKTGQVREDKKRNKSSMGGSAKYRCQNIEEGTCPLRRAGAAAGFVRPPPPTNGCLPTVYKPL
ncbi:hypothetical protein EVAR_14829_1 [Eumeta japonica]|uniref:Uncharacterized protein n=1 Tax=Eumeta variegata TaxID=151549 RepID=A0A4C1V2U9_EUMVA|nr:hypothetical protein EVAR_14829_1 [Eumeta japonica]